MHETYRSMIWEICNTSKDKAVELSRKLGVSTLLGYALLNRGLEDADSAKRFLYPRLLDLYPPFEMKGMSAAISRTMQAKKRGEKVCVYGDYDVDGITSTALACSFLERMGINVFPYIPNRLTEGYSLNENAVRHLAHLGIKLIVTVDCGISNYHEIKIAQSLGIDTIITDHHTPSQKLPEATAILNPKQPGCGYPYEDLAGVGVVFLFLAGLRAAMKDAGEWDDSSAPNLREELDLVALGTIADQVPLTSQNRILVLFGLKTMEQKQRVGIEALKSVSGLEGKTVSSWNIAFQLAPRLNAGGRLGNSSMALKLLTTKEPKKAKEIAEQLDNFNSERRMLEDRITKEAHGLLKEMSFNNDHKSIVLASERWHRGIVGIVASRLVEKFHGHA